MRKWITILLTLSLLLTLAACGKKEEAPPEEDIPAQGDDSALPDNTPEETPEEEIPEMDGDVTFYKGEGITFALPVEYAPQLLLDTGKDVWEPYQPLMSVYELASLEAAEADFGDSAGYGFLFEIGAIDAADLQDFLAAGFSPRTAIATISIRSQPTSSFTAGAARRPLPMRTGKPGPPSAPWAPLSGRIPSSGTI